MKITFSATRPAASDTAIVFAADGAYLPFALFAARQISALHPNRDFDIVIASMDAHPELPVDLQSLGIRFCRIATADTFDGLRLDPGKTQVVYLRLALPAAFSDEYRRLLYLDSDIFVQGGDFSALLGIDLGHKAIGAVRDNTQWRTPRRRPEQFRVLGLPHAPYFNAGVLLIDVASWNTTDIMGRCVAFGRSHHDRMIRHDQNLLNGTLQGDWAELAPTWNWQYTRASMLFEALETPNVIHFISPRKPWSPNTGTLPLRFRTAFRDFIAAHLPDAQQIPDDGMKPMQDRKRTRSVLWRHLLAQRRFSDYLDRFPDDLTVLDPREV